MLHNKGREGKAETESPVGILLQNIGRDRAAQTNLFLSTCPCLRFEVTTNSGILLPAGELADSAPLSLACSSSTTVDVIVGNFASYCIGGDIAWSTTSHLSFGLVTSTDCRISNEGKKFCIPFCCSGEPGNVVDSMVDVTER